VKNEIREYIKQHKTDKPCFDCGKVYPWYVMDYDHLEGKRFNIGSARKTVPSISSRRKYGSVKWFALTATESVLIKGSKKRKTLLTRYPSDIIIPTWIGFC
jgi:hypothetical protein